MPTHTHSRKNSPNLQATVTLGSKTIVRSTGTADGSKATAITASGQRLADAIHSGQRDTKVLLRFAAAIFDAGGIAPPWERTRGVNFGELVLSHAKRRPDDELLHTAIASLSAFLGGPVKVEDLTISKAQDWYAWEIVRTSTGTARNKLCALGGLMAHGVRMGLVDTNPFAMVKKAKAKPVVGKMPLSDADFAKLDDYLRKLGPDTHDIGSWRVAARLGRYAGLRLSDAVNMPMDALQITPGGAWALHFTAGKTKRPCCLPTLPLLTDLLVRLKENGLGTHFCGVLAGKSETQLSEQFTQLLDEAGVSTPIVEHNGRKFRRLSFHSLRHRFVQWLGELGLPQDVRMQLADHSTVSAHAVYEHKTLEAEADKLARRILTIGTTAPESSSASLPLPSPPSGEVPEGARS